MLRQLFPTALRPIPRQMLWEPDPEPAEVIRLMFQMALEGNATAQIRDMLCEARYSTPKEYI